MGLGTRIKPDGSCSRAASSLPARGAAPRVLTGKRCGDCSGFTASTRPAANGGVNSSGYCPSAGTKPFDIWTGRSPLRIMGHREILNQFAIANDSRQFIPAPPMQLEADPPRLAARPTGQRTKGSWHRCSLFSDAKQRFASISRPAMADSSTARAETSRPHSRGRAADQIH